MSVLKFYYTLWNLLASSNI